MKKLFLKELKLDVKWPLYLFSLLGTMVVIPNYPIVVGMGYCMMQIFVYMQTSQANLSQEFASTLPVKRSDIVASTTAVIALFQILTLIVGAACAPLARFVSPQGNIVGMDANLAFFGFALVCYAVFNSIFLPNYFKKGSNKYGLPLLMALIGFVVVYGVFEAFVQAIPTLHAMLDTYDTDYLWVRAVVLAVGIVVYVLSNVLATKCAAKKFEKVSL